jgi:hypothetical protein
MARTSFSGPVASDNGFIGNVTGSLTGMPVLPAYLVAALPTVVVGGLIYVSNANSGAGTVCFGKGTSWIDISTGVAVVA